MNPSRAFQKPIGEDDTSLSLSTTLVVTLLSIYALHRFLILFNHPILTLPELCWNTFIYILPGRFISALHANVAQSQVALSSNEHATKDHIMRSVLRLDHGNPFYSDTIPKAPAGLGNWDNSCYQNSVLQALASLRPLREFLTFVTTPENDTVPGTTAKTLRDLLRDLNNPSHRGKHLWTPPKLKSMSSWQQQDAQEYLSKVLEQVDKDTAREMYIKKNSQASNDVKSLCSFERDDFRNTSNDTVNPLEGLLAQRVGCTRCGFSEGITLIPFNCLTLPVGRDASCTIKECLDEYTKLETIDGVECANCTLLHHQRQLQQWTVNLSAQQYNDDSVEVEAEGKNQAKASFAHSVENRLRAISEALEDGDYSETTLSQKCQIPNNLRITTTKSRQGAIMRPPRCLIMHVNRSVFDELTGAQLKNYARIKYDKVLSLAPWCIGTDVDHSKPGAEQWEMDPSRSMISDLDTINSGGATKYRLRAIITHHGRHENGHYVCFRNINALADMESSMEGTPSMEEEAWWRLSDETVYKVDSDHAMDQDGVFMLFYEQVSQDALAQVDTYLEPKEGLETKSVVDVAITPGLDDHTVETEDGDTTFFADAEESLANGTELASEARHGGHDVNRSLTNDETGIIEPESRVSFASQRLGEASGKLIAPQAMKTAGPDHRVEEDSAFPHMHMIATV